MRKNRSVLRLLAILELISQHEEGLTLGQIYRTLDMPKATAYDFLRTLLEEDAIHYKDENSRNYIIGPKMYKIGSVYLSDSSLIKFLNDDLIEYANKYGKTTFISTLDDGKITYIYKFQPSSSLIATSANVRTVVTDMVNDPIAKVFRIFNSEKRKLSENDLKIYEQGFVVSEPNSGSTFTIAVPVKNFDNKVIGVISTSDLYQEDYTEPKSIESLLEISVNASIRFGYEVK